ncbi:hypothetical protein CMALT430_90059 [Carnobacterium maltaromaticum]|nr:hypothetical protein CMALT394_30110 [Carnobacterium maltaromaticum]CAD5902680.1 hypothetical protein CMALT430_90059 [Carnobacterium maltaromaticum]
MWNSYSSIISFISSLKLLISLTLALSESVGIYSTDSSVTGSYSPVVSLIRIMKKFNHSATYDQKDYMKLKRYWRLIL